MTMGWLSAALVVSLAAQEVAPKSSETPFREMRRPMLGAGCPQGSRRIETAGPIKFRCVVERPGAVLSDVDSQGAGLYKPHRVGEILLDVPRGWHLTQAWSDEVPTLYVEYDTRKPGKRVTMIVSRFEPGQPGYETMKRAIAKEKEYQGATETAPRPVGGLPGRHTIVAGESRAAYLELGQGGYYVLAYSAPERLFGVFEPVFDRLLSSFRAAVR